LRILIYSLNYAPELVGISKYNTDFAAWLTEKGYEVQVICAPPYYPQWKIQSGYSGCSYQRDCHQRTEVFRCPIWVPKKPNGLKRILHLLSFAISSLPILLWRSCVWKPDIIFVIEPPFFCLPGTLLISKLFSSKVWLHIQDLEIDAGFSLGLIPRLEAFKSIVFSLEHWLLCRVSFLSTISEEMLQRIQSKGISKNSITLFPNWVDTHAIKPYAHTSPLRAELRLDAKQIICLYAGNLGAKQGLEILINAARQLQGHTNITFVIAGEGSMRQTLMEQADNLPNIKFLDLQPDERFNDLLNMADIHLLPQSLEAAALVLPSKLKAMFASGRPVISTTATDTQLAQLVTNRGINVQPGNVEQFSKAILLLSQDAALRVRLGNEARNYAIIHWGRNQVLTEIEKQLTQLMAVDLPVACKVSENSSLPKS
jgi:colanic acid biosynthesis glycosyl transferase WcaI